MSGGTAINTIDTAYNADGQVASTGDNYSDYAFGYNGQGDLTVGSLRVSLPEATQFGAMQVDTEKSRIIGFQERPAEPRHIPGYQQHAPASMGIYIFPARFMFEQLCQDATRKNSAHDFGRDIISTLIDSHRVYAFPFLDENRKNDAYWRDVGTLDAYYEANMDLVSVDPQLNMYDVSQALGSGQKPLLMPNAHRRTPSTPPPAGVRPPSSPRRVPVAP